VAGSLAEQPFAHYLVRKSDWRWFGRLALLACALWLDTAMGAERAKTDIVTLQNGDRITCRILYLKYGLLQVNSAHTGSISIEWPSVRSIQSNYSFRVEKFGGQHFAGMISTDPDGKNLRVGTGGDAVIISMQEVTRMLPYESDFWQRINGSVAFGYNFTRSSDVSQLSFQFAEQYSDESREAQLNAQFASTRSSSGDDSTQTEVASYLFFLRPGPNFWGLLSALQRDQNLGIDGRVVFGSVLGRHLYQTGDSRLIGVAGLAVDQEWATDGGKSHSSLESVFGGQWRVFKFSYPKINLNTSLLIYPSITDAPRVRASLNVTLTFKLTDRFSLKLSQFGNYDSRPPNPEAVTLDYGINTSIAYEFGNVVP
jgi:Protein of unknown function, DUF481